MTPSEVPAVSRPAERRFKDPAYVALAGFIAGEARLFQQTELIDP